MKTVYIVKDREEGTTTKVGMYLYGTFPYPINVWFTEEMGPIMKGTRYREVNEEEYHKD